MIDAHQHFWQISRGDCQWPGSDLPAIYRDFLPEHYRAAVEDLDFEGSVLVQSQPCDSDTDFLLDLAASENNVLAVVGWVDLTGASACDRLRYLSGQAKFRGVRPMLQSIEKSDWILGEDCRAAMECIEQLGLRFDALIQPRHLIVIAELARRYPQLAIVVDHGAKPDIANGEYSAWARDIETLAGYGNVHCKLSGLVTEATRDQCADDEIFRPYVEHLCRTFGPQRLLWGSDWPVCTLRASLKEWYALSRRLLESVFGPDHESALAQAVFSDNAKRFYRLNRLNQTIVASCRPRVET